MECKQATQQNKDFELSPCKQLQTLTSERMSRGLSPLVGLMFLAVVAVTVGYITMYTFIKQPSCDACQPCVQLPCAQEPQKQACEDVSCFLSHGECDTDWSPRISMAGSHTPGILPTSEECPRHIFVAVHTEAGLGHRIQNLLMGYTAALVTNFSLAYDGGFTAPGHHGQYPGFEELMALDEFVRLLFRLHSDLEKVHVSALKADPRTFYSQISAFPEGSSWAAIASGLKSRTDSLLAAHPCHVLVELAATWGMHYYDASRFLQYKFSQAFDCMPTLYDATSISVAVHVRYGSGVSPGHSPVETASFTSVEWYIALCSQLVATFHQVGAPFHFYIFTSGEAFPRLLEALPPGTATVIGSEQADAISTLGHFAKSDILVCGSSALCWVAGIGSSKPLVLTEAHTREPFRFIPVANSVQVPDNGKLTQEGGLNRVEIAVDHWQLQRLMGCPVRPDVHCADQI